MGRRQALYPRQEGATAGALDDALAKARAELAAGRFFEGHDTLEERWHELPEGELRVAVQGLIQICAGLHKHAQGNATGARYLLGRGLAKLHGASGALPSGSADPFVEAALRAFAALSEGA